MQEQISQTAKQRCICDILNIKCKHSLPICTCTFCRAKAAPRQTFPQAHRTTASQFAAITRLAKAKQRSLPANISTWSVEFASRYIEFLLYGESVVKEITCVCGEEAYLSERIKTPRGLRVIYKGKKHTTEKLYAYTLNPKEYLSRDEQFDKEHKEGTDYFKAKTVRYGEYYTADCQDAENNPMLSENQKAAQAMEVSND